MPDNFRKDYKPISDEQVALMSEVKEIAQKLSDAIGKAESVGTAGDSIQIARTKVHEAVFWAIHGITA